MMFHILQCVPRSRFGDTPPFHHFFTLLSHRPPTGPWEPNQRRWIACWFQRRGAMLVSINSETRRFIRITHFFLIRSSTRPIPHRRSSFIIVQEVRRSSPLRLALPRGCIVKENRIPNPSCGAIEGLILRQKAAKPAVCHLPDSSFLRHRTKILSVEQIAERSRCPAQRAYPHLDHPMHIDPPDLAPKQSEWPNPYGPTGRDLSINAFRRSIIQGCAPAPWKKSLIRRPGQ